MKAIQATVHGQVQGVGYRWSCTQQAERLGVRGWVRNLPNQTVELWAEGDDQAVDELLAWCRRGPAGARVDEVELRSAAPKQHPDFRVR